jgi:hypothetical protein
MPRFGPLSTRFLALGDGHRSRECARGFPGMPRFWPIVQPDHTKLTFPRLTFTIRVFSGRSFNPAGPHEPAPPQRFPGPGRLGWNLPGAIARRVAPDSAVCSTLSPPSDEKGSHRVAKVLSKPTPASASFSQNPGPGSTAYNPTWVIRSGGRNYLQKTGVTSVRPRFGVNSR